MSEIRAIEKLREYITSGDRLIWFRQDALLTCLDEIEREVDERFVPLPEDARGDDGANREERQMNVMIGEVATFAKVKPGKAQGKLRELRTGV